MNNLYEELIGKRNGSMEILDVVRVNSGTRTALRYKAKCDCGNVFLILPNKFYMNKRCCSDCGIKKGSGSTKHHMSGTKTYHAWNTVKQKATNPKNASYKPNIGMPDKWKTFEGFYEDMGERPEGHKLARKDVKADYNKENCYWQETKTELKRKHIQFL